MDENFQGFRGENLQSPISSTALWTINLLNLRTAGNDENVVSITHWIVAGPFGRIIATAKASVWNFVAVL